MNTAELTLNPTERHPRLLVIRCVQGQWIDASVYTMLSPAFPQMLAYARCDRHDLRLCRLVLRPNLIPSLWLGFAAFNLDDNEAEKVRATFEPLGLRVERPLASPIPSPAVNLHPAAHEAAPPIPLGERGTSPATVFEAEPAELELDNATAAYALTANESH